MVTAADGIPRIRDGIFKIEVLIGVTANEFYQISIDR